MKQVIKLETSELRNVKIYRKAELSPELIKQIQHEVTYFRQLDHPNILKCLDVIEDEHKIYVVTDAVKGVSLFLHIMNQGELSEGDSAIISAQIVSILRYLHKKNIIVRNLSMNTLAFTDSNSITDIKLVDMLMATE